MDPFAAVGLVVVGGVLGYIAASQKYAKINRIVRERVLSTNMESITKLIHASVATLVEDYGHPSEEAQTKLFKRCSDLGVQLRVAKPDGTTAPLDPKEKIS